MAQMREVRRRSEVAAYRGGEESADVAAGWRILTHGGPRGSDCRDHNACPVEIGLRNAAR